VTGTAFADRTVLVTGAAGNLGRAVAAAFRAQGAALVLLDRQRATLEQAYGSGDDRRMLAEADLFDRRRLEDVVAAAVQRHGRIDVLCNVVGGFRMGPPVHETDDATWDLMMDANARSVLRAARAVVPRMIEAGAGKVVNVAAMAGLAGRPGMGAYSASKSATIRLTEAMSAELRHKGINVNCVLPGIIDTPQNRAAMPDADHRTWVPPDALADVVLFLASDAARSVHGAAVPVVGLS
jgi:NAD(P)-dependent dehydrogenase (short-subunit alcohol dehydrogenase family)